MNIASKLYSKLKRQTSSGNYIPEIDGLRFLAIMTVILYHVQLFFITKTPYTFNYDNWIYHFFQNGFKGVEIFFVLSGFILALPFAKYFILGAKKPRLKHFYLRRITRLEPPYVIALILFFILHLVKGQYPIQELFNGLMFNLAYLGNVAWLPRQPIIGNITWTLEVEVQFYLLAPFLASVFYFKKVIRRTILLIGIFGLPILNAILVSPVNSLYNYLFYFLVGLLIADLYITEKKDWISDKVSLVIGTISFAVLYFMNIDPLLNKLLFVALLFVFVYMVLFASVWRRIFSNRLFTVVGGMCYTIYLFHTVIISGFGNKTVFWLMTPNYGVNILIQTIILLIPILLFSVIYFLLVEKPCMNRHWPKNVSCYTKKQFKKISNIVTIKK